MPKGKKPAKAPITNAPTEELLDHYRNMLMIRRFEEKAGQLYGMGIIGGFQTTILIWTCWTNGHAKFWAWQEGIKSSSDNTRDFKRCKHLAAVPKTAAFSFCGHKKKNVQPRTNPYMI